MIVDTVWVCGIVKAFRVKIERETSYAQHDKVTRVVSVEKSQPCGEQIDLMAQP